MDWDGESVDAIELGQLIECWVSWLANSRARHQFSLVFACLPRSSIVGVHRPLYAFEFRLILCLVIIILVESPGNIWIFPKLHRSELLVAPSFEAEQTLTKTFKASSLRSARSSSGGTGRSHRPRR